ncbi:MAG: high frequency lysogenization protein HflD [Thioalkalivibrionaceae bacterium]
MERSDHNRALALAALFQAASLVKDLAWRGHCDDHEFEIVVGSLFRFDASSTEEIYRGIESLHTGLERLRVQLQSGGRSGRPPDMEMTRYAIGLMFLENKLSCDGARMQKLGEGLRSAERQIEYFHLTHESVIGRIADLYQETISTLGPRIVVQGEQTHLTRPEVAARIRACLLAGIRAARLWRQAGGSRWKLLLGRRRLVNAAEHMLQRLPT